MTTIYENSSFDITAEIENLVDDIEIKVQRATKSIERRQNEALASTVLGLVVSGPFIIKLIGKAVRRAERFFKANKNDEGKVSQYILDFADHAHHELLKPFKLLASTFTDDPKKQKVFAEVMISGIIAILLVDSGLSLKKALASTDVNQSLVYAAKSSIKSVELAPQIIELLKFVKRIVVGS